MKRREFITLLGGAAATPLLSRVGRAQQSSSMRRIGVLMGTAERDPYSQSRIGALRKGLEQLGWIEGRNLRMDYRWASGDAMRTQAYARELIALAPEVIVAGGSTPMTALGQQTRTIPIVFANASDPVGGGLVTSLARPGGNVTGFTSPEPGLAEKWLEMIKEVVPSVGRVAVVFNPETVPGARAQFLHSLESTATSVGLRTILAPVRDAAAIESLGVAVGRAPGGSLIVLSDIFTSTHRKLIVDVAARERLPSVSRDRVFAVEGGLMSYGANVEDTFHRAASYVDRILKGEKPADLPVQQPAKFELVINLKTAKAMGLKIPKVFLVRADEVIE
jgi:putative ABC transport system substrate-binding protein